jgi:hypothetical protein
MAMKACGTWRGSSPSGTAAPPMSPLVASGRPRTSRIAIEGGRFGISKEWIGVENGLAAFAGPAPSCHVPSRLAVL